MPRFPEIFVLRHGQTEWNSVGRHQGRMDSPLTAKGRGQAEEQGRLLVSALENRSDITAFCSPQGRAFDTAGIALEQLAMKATVDDRLCEISFGKWEGLNFDEIAKDWPEHCKNADQDRIGWNFTAPGGETYDDIYSRVVAFLEDLDQPTIIVTHGITSCVLRGIWLGLDKDELFTLPGGQGCVYHLNNGTMRRYPALSTPLNRGI